MSDSTLRIANQKALNADIICVSGGNIGDINNSVNYNPDIQHCYGGWTQQY